MRWLGILVLSIVFSPTTFAEDFKDYSEKGGEYSILKNLRLKAISVDFSGNVGMKFLDKTLNASVFRVRTRDAVPFLDFAVDYPGPPEYLYTNYDLTIGRDANNFVHDRLIEDLYLSFSRPPQKGESEDLGFVDGDPSYLLFNGPALMPNLIWFDGRFMQVQFKGFDRKRRDRSPDTRTFWQDKIRIYSGNNKIEIKKTPFDRRGEFLKKYKAGAFTKHGK